jgi:LmbE family N-acetylglucosaminyl deacetylase
MNYKRVLIFGAHPDDELTMAPLMAMLASEGVHVTVCIPTDGSEGYPRPEWRDTIVEMRAREMAEADEVVGISERILLGFPDMGLTNDKATFKRFIKVVRDVRPDVVFTHGPHDSVDVTEFAHIRPLSVATQVSQHTLWGKTREDFEREAEEVRNSGATELAPLWFSERMSISFLPDLP